MSNFDGGKYRERIRELNGRAKRGERYSDDLDIGESCYLYSIIGLIGQFRMKLMSQDELFHAQKDAEKKLLSYYQHSELYDRHALIRNRYSHILTEAEKSGCEVCRRLVRIFDGRNEDA